MPSTLRLSWPATLAHTFDWKHELQPGASPNVLFGLPSCTGGSYSAVDDRVMLSVSIPSARANHVSTFVVTVTWIWFGESALFASQPVPTDPFVAETVVLSTPSVKPLSAAMLARARRR